MDYPQIVDDIDRWDSGGFILEREPLSTYLEILWQKISSIKISFILFNETKI